MAADFPDSVTPSAEAETAFTVNVYFTHVRPAGDAVAVYFTLLFDIFSGIAHFTMTARSMDTPSVVIFNCDEFVYCSAFSESAIALLSLVNATMLGAGGTTTAPAGAKSGSASSATRSARGMTGVTTSSSDPFDVRRTMMCVSPLNAS